MKRKQKMKDSIVYSTEGNKYVRLENERELHKLGIESCPNSSTESGGERNFSIYSRFFTTAVVEKEL